VDEKLKKFLEGSGCSFQTSTDGQLLKVGHLRFNDLIDTVETIMQEYGYNFGTMQNPGLPAEVTAILVKVDSRPLEKKAVEFVRRGLLGELGKDVEDRFRKITDMTTGESTTVTELLTDLAKYLAPLMPR